MLGCRIAAQSTSAITYKGQAFAKSCLSTALIIILKKPEPKRAHLYRPMCLDHICACSRPMSPPPISAAAMYIHTTPKKESGYTNPSPNYTCTQQPSTQQPNIRLSPPAAACNQPALQPSTLRPLSAATCTTAAHGTWSSAHALHTVLQPVQIT